jgi:hypothetical protein
MTTRVEFFNYLEKQIVEAGEDFRDSDAMRLIELRDELSELI